jgi:O-antigen/teichoic acid export membrane protein
MAATAVASAQEQVTHGLKKNIVINLFTKMFPLVVGIVTLPILVNGLGDEKTGILQIAWSIIGYSSFFDLGLSRALTQLISKKLALSETSEIPDIIMTAVASVFLLAVVPMVLLIFARMNILQLLNVSDRYRQEAEWSILWLASSIPAMLIITCQNGILQSYQKFSWITWLSMPAVFGNFIAPVIMLQYTDKLDQIVAVMVLCRFLMAGLTFLAINRCVQNLWQQCRFQFSLIRPLFHFGKWVTISNIINPLMVYLLDRLFLANLFSAKVASYYVVPYGVLQKMTLAPWGIMGVMFPAFSSSFYVDKAKSSKYYFKSLILTAALLFFPVVLIVLFAKPLLALWINPEFAEHSYKLTQVISVALYVCSINVVPSGLIQAAGQADFTAKLQLAEFPIFLFALYFSIKAFGIMAAPATLLFLFLIEGIILQGYAIYLLKTPANGIKPEKVLQVPA